MRRLCARGGALVVGHADRAVGLQVAEALPVRVGLARLGDGGGVLLLRRILAKPVVGVVQHGQHVAFVHELADVDLALRDLAADAEGLVHFIARLHRTDVAVRFAGLVIAEFNGAHRPGRLHGRLVRVARGEHRGGDRQSDDRGK